ncbi:MAG: SPOR domain-containing protein [Magnetococcales bacterium]|nr:SPOR domain-containing protein [Magnetococcales bacterium]
MPVRFAQKYSLRQITHLVLRGIVVGIFLSALWFALGWENPVSQLKSMAKLPTTFPPPVSNTTDQEKGQSVPSANLAILSSRPPAAEAQPGPVSATRDSGHVTTLVPASLPAPRIQPEPTSATENPVSNPQPTPSLSASGTQPESTSATENPVTNPKPAPILPASDTQPEPTSATENPVSNPIPTSGLSASATQPEPTSATENPVSNPIPTPGLSASGTQPESPVTIANRNLGGATQTITRHIKIRGMPDIQPGHFLVLIGTYANPETLESRRKKIVAIGIPVRIRNAEIPGQTLTHLQVGPFSTRQDARKAAALIRKKTGLPAEDLYTRYYLTE